MTERHHLWLQPPPTFYEGTPTAIPLEPILVFSYDTPKEQPLMRFENLSPWMIDKNLTGLTLTFTYNIP